MKRKKKLYRDWNWRSRWTRAHSPSIFSLRCSIIIIVHDWHKNYYRYEIFSLIGYRTPFLFLNVERSDGCVVGSNEKPNLTNINWFLSINKKIIRFYHNIFDVWCIFSFVFISCFVWFSQFDCLLQKIHMYRWSIYMVDSDVVCHAITSKIKNKRNASAFKN